MIDETLDASFFILALFGRQGFVVVSDDQAGGSALGFDVDPGGGSLRRGLGAVKQKVSVVIVGCLDFVLHYLAHEFRGIVVFGNRFGLRREIGRSGEQQDAQAGVNDSASDGEARVEIDHSHNEKNASQRVTAWMRRRRLRLTRW